MALSDRTDEALAVARKVAELRSYSPRFCSRVPWILERAKRYDEAIAAYTALLARFDGERPAKLREILGQARTALDRLDWDAFAAAAVAANRVDDRPPEGREVLRDAPRPCPACASSSTACPKRKSGCKQVLDEFPDDIGADNDLGYLWADQGVHLDRAWQMIGRAVAAEPDNAAYRDSLGWICYRLGRYPEAVVELEKAAAKEPVGDVLEHLGDAQLKAGQVEKADAAWRRAAAAFRKDKEEEKAVAVEKK